MSEGSVPVQEGEIVGGKYLVGRPLGQGGMATVVAASHLQLEMRVALKFLRADLARDPLLVARFSGEAQAAAKIQSEHVGRVLDVGTLPNGLPYLVMEYLEGEDLEHVLARPGRLPIADAVDYLLQACEAVAEAHALGIIHRDLKPSNLFLANRSSGRPAIKVLDFGISKVPLSEGKPGLTQTAVMLGSPPYMSPEQLKSSRSVDARSDVWSLGAVLYEMLTGGRPFESDSPLGFVTAIMHDDPQPPRSRRADIPPELEVAVLRCLEKDPARRFSSVAELAVAIGRFGLPRSQQSVERISHTLGIPFPPDTRRPVVEVPPAPDGQPESDPVAAALARALKTFGPQLADEPARLRGVLLDECPSEKRQIAALMQALAEKIPAELGRGPRDEPLRTLFPRLGKRLSESYAMAPDAANWAVLAWARALGLDTAGAAAGPVIKPVVDDDEWDDAAAGSGKPAPPGGEVRPGPEKKWRIGPLTPRLRWGLAAGLVVIAIGALVAWQASHPSFGIVPGATKAELYEQTGDRAYPGVSFRRNVPGYLTFELNGAYSGAPAGEQISVESKWSGPPGFVQADRSVDAKVSAADRTFRAEVRAETTKCSWPSGRYSVDFSVAHEKVLTSEFAIEDCVASGAACNSDHDCCAGGCEDRDPVGQCFNHACRRSASPDRGDLPSPSGVDQVCGRVCRKLTNECGSHDPKCYANCVGSPVFQSCATDARTCNDLALCGFEYASALNCGSPTAGLPSGDKSCAASADCEVKCFGQPISCSCPCWAGLARNKAWFLFQNNLCAITHVNNCSRDCASGDMNRCLGCFKSWCSGPVARCLAN